MPTIPRVSVIVATYNRGVRIVPTLRSILAQSVTDLEVWVVGDACTDNTGAVVADLGDSRVHWHNCSSNSGSQATPNNEGLSRSRAPYVAYLGHDDLWFPWHLESLLSELERTGADMVHDLTVVLDPDENHGTIGGPGAASDYSDHFVPPSAWVHRREFTDKLKGWRHPSTLRHPPDCDILIRAAGLGASIRFIPRLGVLKWSSQRWNAYSPRSSFPQIHAWTRMTDSAERFESETLNALAAALARGAQSRGRAKPTQLLPDARVFCRGLISIVFQACASAYGRDRWPLREYLIQRHQRQRKGIRRERGL